MNSIKELERLRVIHKSIKSETTGKPKELASKLHVCESHLYNILEDLKIKGFPIKYNRNRQTYYYDRDCELDIVFSVKLLTEDEQILIVAGFRKKHLTTRRVECTAILS